jgi:anti-sigma factor RsiW
MSHLDEGTLHALLDGELELAEVREIQMHLGTCAACGSRLQDVKQFLAEADRLVGALELPAGGIRSHPETLEPRQPPLTREPAPEPAPAPKPFREPGNWEEPPVLLIPDPLDGLERRRKWMRGLRLAAMIAAVFVGGRLISNALKPSKPELQFTERDLAQPAPPTPAVVSPRETVRPEPPVVAKQSRPSPAPSNRDQEPKPAPTPTALADESTEDTATDQLDTVVAAVEDSAPLEEVVATKAESIEPGAAQPSPDEADLETRRAAAAALAELDRERMRSRANAATAALPAARTEVPEATEAPPPPRTLEQRAQIYLRIGLDEAARQLGRPMHVIEAMSPQFIGLTQGRVVPGADDDRPVVRVVYLDSRGRMVLLDQQRMRPGQAPGGPAGSLRWALGDVMLYLHGEPGPDVLRSLQRRVR